jgi:hypothetical protein
VTDPVEEDFQQAVAAKLRAEHHPDRDRLFDWSLGPAQDC